jgi:hypothetical protein
VAKKFLQLAGPTKNFRNNLPNEANFHRRNRAGNPQHGRSSITQPVQVVTDKNKWRESLYAIPAALYQ